MQFKIIRHRDKDGGYRQGHRVQCLRRVREVTPDFPHGRNVQRVVAKFDRVARELPADVLAILTPSEVDEWKAWRVKEDEERLAAVAQFELDTLAESIRVARIGLMKECVSTTTHHAQAIRRECRALIRVMAQLGLMPRPVRGRPEKEDGADVMGPLVLSFAPPGSAAYEAYQRMMGEFERSQSVLLTNVKE